MPGRTGSSPGSVRVASEVAHMFWQRWLMWLMAAFLAALVGANGSYAATSEWPAYLGGPAHGSVSASTAITVANASNLHLAWHWTPPAVSGRPASTLLASPTVYNGVVFEGTNSGYFYALSQATGSVLWHDDLGYVPALTCESRGITSTATVAPDPSPERAGKATVYVAGGDGYLYALDASTGQLVWRTMAAPPSADSNGYYNWSSPTVIGGHVYLGVSSQCDKPFVPGGVKVFDQATGQEQNDYWSMPSGYNGGGVWSSVAASQSSTGIQVWATTGSTVDPSEDPTYPQGDSYSIVRLDGTTMQRQDIWTIPSSARGFDADFGASPALFTAFFNGAKQNLVAACNKNGILYAWNANNLAAGPIWTKRIETPASSYCLAAPVFTSGALYQAGRVTTIGNTKYLGSIRRFGPAAGGLKWATGLPAGITGTPSLNSAGVLAVSSWDYTTSAQNGTWLLNSSNGAILASFPSGVQFAQPVFSGDELLLATVARGLNVYQAPVA
jgi:outer membrane protein assembly factor BamB